MSEIRRMLALWHRDLEKENGAGYYLKKKFSLEYVLDLLKKSSQF